MSVREIDFTDDGGIILAAYGSFDPATFPGATIIGTPGTGANDNIAVVRLNATGAADWVTIIGGSGKERAYGLEIDDDGAIHIAGGTSSPDFPVTPGAFDTTFNGGDPNPAHGARDMYALKLAADGQSLIYATYLGGARNEAARGGLTLDPEGRAIIVGYTWSPDFLGPIDEHVNSFTGSDTDAIVLKLAADGSAVVWNRFVGGPGPDIEEVVVGARVDAAGRVRACAIVRAPGAPTTDGSVFNGGEADLYHFRLSADGQTLEQASYFGGAGGEFMEHRLVIDEAGGILVVGATTSTDLPFAGGDQPTFGGGGADAFLVRFGADGAFDWGTYIGGSGGDTTYGPIVSADGTIWTGGSTSSADFPTTDGTTFGGVRDFTLRRYSADGVLIQSHLVGGAGDDRGRYGSIDGTGNVYLLGETESADLPTTPGTLQPNYNGGRPAAIIQLQPASLAPDPDLDGDGTVGFGDLVLQLGSWGPCLPPCPPTCTGDLDASCTVGLQDVLTLLAAWR